MGGDKGMRNRAVQLATSAVALVGLGVLAMDLPAGALTQSQLKAKALSLSDMPTGWSVDNSSGGIANATGCLKVLSALKKPAKGVTHAEVSYEQGDVPALQETIDVGKGESSAYTKFLHILNGCTTVSFSASGTNVTGSVGAMSFPTVGDESAAYAFTFSVKGINLGLDLVVFKAGSVVGDIGYEDIGSPDTDMLQQFATEAVDKIEDKAVTPPSDT